MYVITGANGFIGSAMVWELNQLGISDIVAVDRVSVKERPQLLRPLKFQEFLLADELFDLLRRPAARQIKAVFHMGACSSTTEMNVEFLRKNNTEYTQRLFNAAIEHKWPLIYASSGAVYGNGENGFDDAESSKRFQPLNPYGWSKANFDVWAEQQKTTPPRWYGLRFFNVFGPNEYHKGDMASVVYKAFQQIQETGKLKLFRSHNPKFKDGEQMRDFVYVKDITKWMWELYKNEGAKSGIYNMGFGKARTWLDLATAVFANMGRPLNIDWIDVPENIRNQYQYFTEAKISRLLDQKVHTPGWSLEAGIADYMKKYLLKDNPYLG